MYGNSGHVRKIRWAKGLSKQIGSHSLQTRIHPEICKLELNKILIYD